ncbi:10475_t:CDS:2, partial [Gigaspora rosea]
QKDFILDEQVNGTPSDYVDLMTMCWDNDPDKRPEAGKIMNKMKDMLRDIYANDIIQELKLVPVNRKSTKWNILKGANSGKRSEFSQKNYLDLQKKKKQSISENTSTLLLLEEDRCFSKDKTSITEQDKSLHSPLSISEQNRATTTINARLFPIIEQDESNATDVCPIPSK